MSKVRALQQSGMAYDNSLFMLGIVGYYYPPRWLEEFDAKWLSTYVPAWKLDLPHPPDAPKVLHYEWRQRALKALFAANQMLEARYHEALIELNTLGRDIVDDPEVVAIYNAQTATYPAARAGWGSANSTAWGQGRDTRATPAPVWAPNPGPAPAEGQPVSIIVARGELPTARNSQWGSQTPHRASTAQLRRRAEAAELERESSAERQARDLTGERAAERERAQYIQERDSERRQRQRRDNRAKWTQSNNWAAAHRQPPASNPRDQPSHAARSGGKRSQPQPISSDEESDAIRSEMGGYSSQQPSSSARKLSKRLNVNSRGGKSRSDQFSLATIDQAWDEAIQWQESEKVTPMRGPNFSNDPPPTFTPEEISAKDILYAERAAHRAREEEAKKAALAISHALHGPPRPPPKEPVTPIPAALSALKPTAAFVMPATPTPLPVVTPISESTKRMMAASCTTPGGLVVFPKPIPGC